MGEKKRSRICYFRWKTTLCKRAIVTCISAIDRHIYRKKSIGKLTVFLNANSKSFTEISTSFDSRGKNCDQVFSVLSKIRQCYCSCWGIDYLDLYTVRTRKVVYCITQYNAILISCGNVTPLDHNTGRTTNAQLDMRWRGIGLCWKTKCILEAFTRTSTKVQEPYISLQGCVFNETAFNRQFTSLLSSSTFFFIISILIKEKRIRAKFDIKMVKFQNMIALI